MNYLYEIIAYGATVQVAILFGYHQSSKFSDLLLLDATPFS